MWIDDLKFGEHGLVPVVAQDAATGEVLMLAYATRDALERTRETGLGHYWSRSRGELWQKGATSGHVQRVVEVRVDCDGDAVLYRVDQQGPACHTLERSCFHRRVEQDALCPAPAAGHVLARLERIVEQRAAQMPEGSYTTYLFREGLDKILKKVGEETAETLIAAKNRDAGELRAEIADLLFHLVVLLREQNVELDVIWRELDDRFGGPTRVPASGAKHHPDS